jgi:hypothetical protein
MMSFEDFDLFAVKEQSDRLARLLEQAGIRIKRHVIHESGRRPAYVIVVHPDDLGRAEEVRSEASRRECEEFARSLRFVREFYSDQDMLITREPDDAGFYVSGVYKGEPFDETRFEVVRGGWDHEHCHICYAKVMAGEEWWAAEPPHEIGLCLECYARLFGH